MTATHDIQPAEQTSSLLEKFVVIGLIVLGYVVSIGAILIPIINYMMVVE
jgi:hypothetical protein